MEYQIIYLLGLEKRMATANSFDDALSFAENLYNAGFKYVGIKDDTGSIIVEFEN